MNIYSTLLKKKYFNTYRILIKNFLILSGSIFFFPATINSQSTALTLNASPTSGNAPLIVSFEAILEQKWDYNGDGKIDDTITSTSEPVTFIYTNPGTYNPTVSVDQNKAIITSDPVTINVTAAPAPTPTPTPTLTPTSSAPSTDDDTGTANAPLIPANKVVKTVCARGCDYKTPQAAIDAAALGWTIQVKDGIYTSGPGVSVASVGWKRGTQSDPFTLMAFPGHHPIFDCTGTGSGEGTDSSQNGISLFQSSWWIIDGLEIRGCYWGIRPINVSNITIRNNKIHHTRESGITTNFSNDLYIAGNEIYHNGTIEGAGPDGCPASHKFCHGIYLAGKDTNDPDCITRAVTMRRNYIHDHSGLAMHLWSGNSCLQIESNILVENNLMVDNAFGFQFSKGYLGNTMRNNTVVLTNPPPIVESPYKHYYSLLQLGYAPQQTPQNKIYNNIFYLDKTSYDATGTPRPAYPLITRKNNDNVANILDFNLWFVPYGSKWIWSNKLNENFPRDYKTITDWDKNGPPVPSDADFVDLLGRDFHLNWSSPAIDAGDISNAPTDDFDGKLRDIDPDMGAFEY